MMRVSRIADQLFFSTVLIEAVSHARVISRGTAFVFDYIFPDKTHAPFLVTNKHVIRGAARGSFAFQSAENKKPVVGQPIRISLDNFEGHWYEHPNKNIDIAIMPLGAIVDQIRESGKRAFYKAIPHHFVPTNEQLENLSSIEEVLFVGYPSGIMDEKNLIPVVRKGITATPVHIDYQGEPIFLVDAAVFPGSSGSPVFIYNPGMYATETKVYMETRIFFLGVISQVLKRRVEGQIEFVPIPTDLKPVISTHEMLNLGLVYKASTVLEAVTEFLKQSELL
jgi:hypothetical protein